MLSLIAAISEDGYLTRATGIPWRLPDDISHFRETTAGHTLLVGRTTYEEMRGWFTPEHTLLLVSTSSPSNHSNTPKVHHFATITDALVFTRRATDVTYVIGGASIYRQTLEHADQLILTHVHTHLGEGKRFPAILASEWQITKQVHHPADEHHAYSFDIITYSPATSTLRK